MDDTARDPEETALDLKNWRTGKCFYCLTKKWPQNFSCIVAATHCLAVKAAWFLEREGKHFFLVILFLVLHSLSLFCPLSSPQTVFQFYCQNSHFMASQLSAEYFQFRSTPSVTSLWKYFFQEETSLLKCKKGDKFTGELIAKQMCWWYLKNYWQLLLAEFKQQ